MIWFFVWLLAMLRIRFGFAGVLKLNNLDYKSMLSAAACRIMRVSWGVMRLSPLTSAANVAGLHGRLLSYNFSISMEYWNETLDIYAAIEFCFNS